MNFNAKHVLVAATRSEHYGKLPDAEKLIWMIEQAYAMGRRSTEPQVKKGRGDRDRSH